MERRPRTKSKTRKDSPQRRPKKSEPTAKSPARTKRPRGRPAKERKRSPSDDSESRSPSRSRSRSASSSNHVAKNSTGRKSNNSNKPSTRNSKSEEEQSIKAGVKPLTIPINVDEVNIAIRRSLSRDIPNYDVNIRTRSQTTTRTEVFHSIPKTTSEIDVGNKNDFGGSFGAVANMFAMFLILVALILGCTKDQCELKPFHIHRNWRVYFKWEALALIFAFITSQALFAAIPIGRIVKCRISSAWYRANGFLALILTGGVFGSLWYAGQPITRIYEYYIPLAVISYTLAIGISIALYFKAKNARLVSLNPYGNTGDFFYDFYVGRELNPMIFNINLKIVLLRFCVIGSIVVDALLALKGYEVRKELSPTLLTMIGLKIFYCLDSLWFEELFSTTFESQSEGLGLMAIQGFLCWPFFSSTMTRFVLMHKIELPIYALILSILVFAVGFFIYRSSNLQKATFRTNPNASAISHLETIKTSRGKKLLVTGWWGWVKHPNYLGDIIMAWSISSLNGFSHAIPHIVAIVTTIFLIHRAKRDIQRCKERYEGAWREYDKRVPYSIFPKIY